MLWIIVRQHAQMPEIVIRDVKVQRCWSGALTDRLDPLSSLFLTLSTQVRRDSGVEAVSLQRVIEAVRSARRDSRLEAASLQKDGT